jgi:KRAB domain-containing zinc finger protein
MLPEEERPSKKCSKCEAYCWTEQGMKEHLTTVHDNDFRRIPQESNENAEIYPEIEVKIIDNTTVKEKVLNTVTENVKNTGQVLWVFKCTICGSVCKEKQSMANHNKEKHGGSRFIYRDGSWKCAWIFKCTICSKELTSNPETHVRSAHDTWMKDGMKLNDGNLNRGLMKNGEDKATKTQLEINVEKQSDSVHEGINLEGKRPRKQLLVNKEQVDIEVKKIMEKDSEKQNKPVQEGESVWVYVCTICAATFKRRQDMTKHNLANHEGKRFFYNNGSYKCTWAFQCAICTQLNQFSSKPGITEHVKLVHNIEIIEPSEEPFQEESNFQCAMCDDIFENRTKLALHIEMKHTKATQKKPKSPLKAELMCPFCQKEFREKSQFTVHISKTRNGQCPTVNEISQIQSVGSPKKADHRSNLEDGSDVEVFFRGGKKFFKCRFCSKDFSTKRNLESHVQLVHDDSDSAEDDEVTPYSPINSPPKETFKCIKCNLEFTEKLSLTEHYSSVHASVHEKKKPFKCSICRKAFVSKGNVKLHIVAVHKKNKNQADDFIYEDTTSSDTSVDKGDTKSSKSVMKSVKVLPKPAEETRYSLEHESELAVKNLLGISPKKDSAEDCNLEPEIMAETLFEDKRPILRCSICNFEVKSVPSMENHVSAVHGLKLKLEVIDSNNTETPVSEVARTTELGETSINEALNTENQSAKPNNLLSGNTQTKMEAKNEKSIGLLRSFRMNKQDDDVQKSFKKLEKESDVKRNDIEKSIVSQLGLDPNIPMGFKCTICDLELNSLETLTEHFSSEHAESQITFAGSDVPESLNETTIPHEPNHEVHETVTREMIEAQGFQGDLLYLLDTSSKVYKMNI